MNEKFTSIIILICLVYSCGCSRKDNKRKVLQNKGSDTLVNVAQAWAEEYGKLNRSLVVAVSGGGSGTGISAMINGTVDIANSSRKMKDKEILAARKNKIEPVEHIVGYDALAVYVHKDNPIKSLTIKQLAEIYGENGTIEYWSDLGIHLANPKDNKIVRVSRQNNSGTYLYFRRAILGKFKNYKFGSLDLHGSKDVVDLVKNTPGSIGYSGLAYATKHVRLVPISKYNGEPIYPSIDTAISRTYPIARPLFMYTAGKPIGHVKDYLDWILSDEGQRIILLKGYAPVRKVD